MDNFVCWVLASDGGEWNHETIKANNSLEAAGIYARMYSYTNHNVYVRRLVQTECFNVVAKLEYTTTLVNTDEPVFSR
jgi:hypothetical protein